MLGELFNFVPESEINKYFKKEAQHKARIQHTNQLLSNFVYAYKSFQSGTMGQQKSGYGDEHEDRDTLVKMSLAFGPGTVSTLLEVGVGIAQPKDCLPHGRA